MQGESRLVFSQGGSPQCTVDRVPARVWHDALPQAVLDTLAQRHSLQGTHGSHSPGVGGSVHPLLRLQETRPSRRMTNLWRKQARHERLSSACLNVGLRTAGKHLARATYQRTVSPCRSQKERCAAHGLLWLREFQHSAELCARERTISCEEPQKHPPLSTVAGPIHSTRVSRTESACTEDSTHN